MAKTKAKNAAALDAKGLLGADLNFAAAEAYRLLRTNLAFSLPSSEKCKVIGVTSALAGEGKTTTALNIAYTIAQEGKHVLVLEGDLRLPTIAKRLKLNPQPGLSNLLVGQCTGNDVLQRSSLSKNVYIVTAGNLPPNPAELLNSDQMGETIQALSEVFDVIIVDLPPVTVVTDALVASKHLDGMVIVVRQRYCVKKALAELVRQMKFANVKILGFVMTDSDVQKKHYKKYKKNYYYDGGYSYDKSHAER